VYATTLKGREKIAKEGEGSGSNFPGETFATKELRRVYCPRVIKIKAAYFTRDEKLLGGERLKGFKELSR